MLNIGQLFILTTQLDNTSLAQPCGSVCVSKGRIRDYRKNTSAQHDPVKVSEYFYW